MSRGRSGPRALGHRLLRAGLAARIPRIITGESSRAGRQTFGPSPISAPTGWTWPSHVTGTPIRAVCADLATFHPRRFAPRQARAKRSRAQSSTSPAANAEVEITTDDYGAVLLRFDGGARGSFHVSQVTAGRKNRLTIEIAGSEGSAAWDSESPNQLWLGSRKGPNQLLERDPALLSAGGQIDHPLPGRARRGVSRYVQAALPGRLSARSSRAGVPVGRRVSRLCRWRSRSPPLRGDRPERRCRATGCEVARIRSAADVTAQNANTIDFDDRGESFS